MFGDIMTADHKVLSEENETRLQQKCALCVEQKKGTSALFVQSRLHECWWVEAVV